MRYVKVLFQAAHKYMIGLVCALKKTWFPSQLNASWLFVLQTSILFLNIFFAKLFLFVRNYNMMASSLSFSPFILSNRYSCSISNFWKFLIVIPPQNVYLYKFSIFCKYANTRCSVCIKLCVLLFTGLTIWNCIIHCHALSW